MPADRVKAKMVQGSLLSAELFGRGRMLGVFKIAPPPGREMLSFKAGQYATIGLDKGGSFVPRPYSIASAPESRDHLELYLALVESGALTPAMWSLKKGDPVWYMGGAKGRFTLEGISQKHIVMVGTGTGLAPFLSMLRSLRISQNQGRPHGKIITLMHGVRYLDDLGYREELSGLAADPSFNLAYMPTVSRPESGPGSDPAVATGRVNDVFRALLNEPPDGKVPPVLARTLPASSLLQRMPAGDTVLLLCGNPAMGTDLKAIAPRHGYGDIRTEDYW